MSITFVGVGTANAKNNLSVTPTLPSGLQVGDLMLCFASARGAGILGTPTGWTQKWQKGHGTSGINIIALFYRFYQAGDGNPTVTYSFGASGDTVIGQVCAFRGVDSANPFDVTGAQSDNAAQQNIGPITGITTGTKGTCVIVFGHKADDWTSVATLSGDGLTWNEIGEPDSTLGNDAGEVWDYAISTTPSIVVSAKTFTVTGGISQTGMGVMQSLNKEVILTGWSKLQYFSEPPTAGQFNKLRFASEPPVSGAFNKLLYEGE